MMFVCVHDRACCLLCLLSLCFFCSVVFDVVARFDCLVIYEFFVLLLSSHSLLFSVVLCDLHVLYVLRALYLLCYSSLSLVLRCLLDTFVFSVVFVLCVVFIVFVVLCVLIVQCVLCFLCSLYAFLFIFVFMFLVSSRSLLS